MNTNQKVEKIFPNALNLEWKLWLLFQDKIKALILTHRLIILWPYHNVICLEHLISAYFVIDIQAFLSW